MTEEKLVFDAQSGDAKALAELWKSVRLLSKQAAGRFSVFANTDGAVDLEDLYQAAALAFLEFVKRYRSDMGCTFTGGLYNYIGWRIISMFDPRKGKKGDKPSFVSLDAPLPGEDGEDLTLADTIEDEAAKIPFEELAPRTDLGRAVEDLPDELQRVIRLRYFEDRPWKTVAEKMGCTVDNARNLGGKATAVLRRDRRLNGYRSDPVDWRHVTLAEYKLTGISTVEKAVLHREQGKEHLDAGKIDIASVVC